MAAHWMLLRARLGRRVMGLLCAMLAAAVFTSLPAGAVGSGGPLDAGAIAGCYAYDADHEIFLPAAVADPRESPARGTSRIAGYGRICDYDDRANLARPIARRQGYRSAPNTTGAGALTSSQRAQYLFDNWHPATFPNRTQSINYHLAKHGQGRSAFEYTRDAQQFFTQNRNLATPVTLKDGTAGLRVQTKVPLPGGGTNTVGGYWTSAGRLVTFWD